MPTMPWKLQPSWGSAMGSWKRPKRNGRPCWRSFLGQRIQALSPLVVVSLWESQPEILRDVRQSSDP